MERGKKTKDRDIILALTLQAKEIKEVHSKLKKKNQMPTLLQMNIHLWMVSIP